MSNQTQIDGENEEAQLVVSHNRPPSQNRWSLATDVVMRATATMPEHAKEQCRWLQNYALAANLAPAEIAARIMKPDGTSYSEDSIYQLLTGKRSAEGANPGPMADAIRRFRRLVEEVEARTATPFIETPLTRKVFRICRRAMDLHRVAFIYGESQIGKTTTANEFQRQNNHGRARIIRFPASGSMGDTYSEFALSLGLPVKRRVDDLRRRIINSFDETNLLIIDEAHACLIGKYTDGGARPLEFVREIHDRRKCGVVLIGTDALREGLKNNRVLQQFWKRRTPGLALQLPANVPDEDLNAFSKAFGLEPATDRDLRVHLEGDRGTATGNPAKLQREIVLAQGLGPWIRLLEDARDLAKEARKPLTWGRVVATYCDALANEG